MNIVTSNEALWIGMLIANFAAIIIAYRLFGIVGLYVWIALAGVIANIQVSKTVEIFGITATLGNIVYAGSYLATDILSERYGRSAAARGVGVGFFAILSATLIMQIAVLFEPAASDQVSSSLQVVFGVLPRIAIASVLAYAVSQSHDVWAFHHWKVRFPALLWLRNNMSTIVSQLIDSVVFTVVAFVGVFPTAILVEIALSTYLFKVLVALVDTPFLYLATRWINPSEHAACSVQEGTAEV